VHSNISILIRKINSGNIIFTSDKIVTKTITITSLDFIEITLTLII